MGWPKGKPRDLNTGRKKGTPNKRTQSLEAICEAYNYHPFEALLKLTMETEEVNVKLQGLKELCQYLYPKRKALEISGDINLDLAREAEAVAKLSEEEQIEIMRRDVEEWDKRKK